MMNYRKVWVVAMSLIIVSVFGYVLIFGYSNLKKEVAIKGTTICLPLEDKTLPPDGHCRFGIETILGEYYAIDVKTIDKDTLARINEGSELVVKGRLQSLDGLNIDSEWLNYDIKGVIRAGDLRPINNAVVSQQTFPGGQVFFERPEDFGLAVSGEKILKESSIPPCDEGFHYCLYYSGNIYDNTNFEIAGVRLSEMDNLKSQNACITTKPSGYNLLSPTIFISSLYSTSIFSPTQDLNNGHSYTGEIRRLYYDSKCYEIETRIVINQFKNNLEGSLKEFGESNLSVMKRKLDNIIESIHSTEGYNFYYKVDLINYE